MKIKKYITIFSLLIMLICCISAVSAVSDNVINNTESEDNFNEELLLISNASSKTLNGGTFEDIQNAVDECSDGDVIELNGRYESTGNIISVVKNLTIKGNGAVLDGKDRSVFFYFNRQNSIVLDGVTFVNGYDSNPTVDCISIGHGKIINCNFKDNHNRLYCNNPCMFVNCSFTNSVTVLRAGNIINCSFTNMSDSGAVAGAGDIINCSFIDNFGSYSAGALSNVGAVINCKFINNRGGSQGAISNAKDVVNCIFINNSAQHSGSGAVYDVGDVINCSFTNNSVHESYQNSGGAIHLSRDIVNCSFINNSVSEKGSVVYLSGDMINCSFVDNIAKTWYGMGDFNCSIENCNFTNTKNIFLSGDIVNSNFENSSLISNSIQSNVSDCSFINYVNIYKVGDISFVGCNFTGNGLAYSNLQLLGSAYISDCMFSNMYYIRMLCPDVHLENSRFVKTAASVGLDYQGKCYSQVVNCSFEQSNGRYALELPDGNASVVDCNFFNNNAGSIDIGFQAQNPVTNIKNCNFTNNLCHHGTVTGSNFNVIGCRFTNNVAKASCGAIYCIGYCNVTDSSFLNNSAGGGSGAIYCTLSNIVNCSFIKNSVKSQSTGYGGAIDCAFSTIRNCYFAENSAANGGAMRCIKSVIGNCTFKKNSAYRYGSAIEVPTPYSENTISNSVFSNNHAQLNRNTMGYPVINYANSAIVKAGIDANLKIIKCVGLSKNSDKYKIKTDIVPTSGASYKNGNYLTFQFINSEFNDYPLSFFSIDVKLNNKVYHVITDENGQGKLLINQPANTYTAKITYSGNNFFLKASKNVKITVKKASPKLTANKMTFKKSVKTKKYTVTLKTSQNKPVKNALVSLKVNKKTYTAKTNSNGSTTFKITNLNQKGTFTAVVNYAGNSYYNAKTAKTKITVK